MQEIDAARAASIDALAELKGMFMAHVRFTIAYPGVPRLIFAELQQPDGSAVRERVQLIMQRYRKTLAISLAQAMEAKLIRPNVDVQAAAALFLGAIQGLVMQSMLSGPMAKAEHQAAGVLKLYLAGLGVES